MVVATQQRTREVRTGLHQLGYLLVENLESLPGYDLPFADVGSAEDAGDVDQREPCVLEHAYEHEFSESGDTVPTLSRRSSIGHEQVEALVVANRGGGDARSLGDLSDAQQGL